LPVLKVNNPEVDIEYVKHRLKMGENLRSGNNNFDQIIRTCIKEAAPLANPVFYYRIVRIEKIGKDSVRLADGLCFNSSFLSRKPGEAKKVLVGVFTIEPELEERGRELREEKGLMHSFICDALGIIIMDLATKEFIANIEKKLSFDIFYPGLPFSPGDTPEWQVEDQRKIFEYLEDEINGIKINEAGVLIPKNSASFIIGIYDHPVRKEGESNCTYCSMREKCLYRQ